LTKNGVLFALHRFRPYVEDRSSGESVMLIRAKNGQTRPASQISPLIRHLRELWTEDIHLYAFAEQNNPITNDEALALLGTEGDSSA